MSERTWIGLGAWISMTPAQRSAFRQACGGDMGINLTDLGGAPVGRDDLDRLEYVEEMSLGGRIYDPNDTPHQMSRGRRV